MSANVGSPTSLVCAHSVSPRSDLPDRMSTAEASEYIGRQRDAPLLPARRYRSGVVSARGQGVLRPVRPGRVGGRRARRDRARWSPVSADGVREARMRRVAARQGMQLQKSRARDHRAVGYGTFQLADPLLGALYHGENPDGRHGGYGLTLDEIARALGEVEG